MADPLRLAMVGGGKVADAHYVGAVHGAGMVLVAGAFSPDRDRSRMAGHRFGVDPARCYADISSMLAAEATHDRSIDLVAIVTPNHLHLPGALAALASGVHVMSDKPATATLAEALMLVRAIAASDCRYALTYTYTGYPMVRKARAMVASGAIGVIRKIVVTYQQGWLAVPRGSSVDGWRTDPARSGSGGACADIGVHAFHLAEFVSGLRVAALHADGRTLRRGALLDDDCNVLLRFEDGQSGVLIVSQVAFGEGNSLSFSLFGDAGAIHWAVATADELLFVTGDGKRTIVRPDTPDRWVVPPPDGVDERHPATAFATLYRDFAAAIAALGDDPAPLLPGIDEGVRGMRFVDHAAASRATGPCWRRFDGDAHQSTQPGDVR